MSFMDNAELDTVVSLKNQKPHRGLVFLCFFHKSCGNSSGNVKGILIRAEVREVNQSVNGGVRTKVRKRLPASLSSAHHYS